MAEILVLMEKLPTDPDFKYVRARIGFTVHGRSDEGIWWRSIGTPILYWLERPF